MEFSAQIKTFLLIAATGIFLGVLFDTYRVLRRCFRPSRLITSLADLIYCLIASAIAFAALLAGNWGELRFYIFIALIIGLAAYYRIASKQVMKLIMAVLKLIAKGWRMTKLAFVFTLIKPTKFIARTLIWPFRFIARKCVVWYKRWLPPPPPPEETRPPE